MGTSQTQSISVLAVVSGAVRIALILLMRSAMTVQVEEEDEEGDINEDGDEDR